MNSPSISPKNTGSTKGIELSSSTKTIAKRSSGSKSWRETRRQMSTIQHSGGRLLGDLCAIVSGRQAIFGDDRFPCYYPRQTQLAANRRQRPAHHDVFV